MKRGRLTTCFDLPFVGTRELSAEEIAIYSKALGSLRKSVVFFLLCLVGSILLLSLTHDKIGTFIGGYLAAMSAMVLLNMTPEARHALRALRSGSLDTYRGKLPGYVVEYDKPHDDMPSSSKLIIANSHTSQLLGKYIKSSPEVEQTVELLSGTKIIYTINGELLRYGFDATESCGTEEPYTRARYEAHHDQS